jgi:hypothetical protein
MPTKATVHILPTDLPTRDVEIPDACPKCGADLTQRGAMYELSYVFAHADCHVDPSSPTAGPEVEDSTESDFGEMIRLGYACQACAHDLTAESAHVTGMREVAHVLTADSLEVDGRSER